MLYAEARYPALPRRLSLCGEMEVLTQHARRGLHGSIPDAVGYLYPDGARVLPGARIRSM